MGTLQKIEQIETLATHIRYADVRVTVKSERHLVLTDDGKNSSGYWLFKVQFVGNDFWAKEEFDNETSSFETLYTSYDRFIERLSKLN